MLVINDFSNCVKVPVKNGVIYTETLTDYDELIGDISREGKAHEMLKEVDL